MRKLSFRKVSFHSIAVQLALSFGGVCALLLLISVGNYWLSARTQDSVGSALEVTRRQSEIVEALRTELLQAGTAIRDAALTEDPQEVPKVLEAYTKHWAAYGAASAALQAQPLPPSSRKWLEGYLEMNKQAADVLSRASARARSLEGEAVKVMLMDFYAPLQKKMLLALDEFAQREAQAAAASVKKSFDESLVASRAAAGFSLLASSLVALLAWRVTRGIGRPLRAATLLAERVACGDLTQGEQARGKDELSVLLRSLEAMRKGLAELVLDVKNSTHQIAQASNEIAQGNSDLSNRTEQQAAQLQQTTASTKALASSVLESAERAEDADALAHSSHESTLQGNNAIQCVIGTMEEIEQSSNRIAEINGVVDSLAFQTNILALNAAVEAARAGEQGRGFSVVASEVRSLAQRCSNAAREIRSLIETSRGKVELGIKHVQAAGNKVGEITSGVNDVSQIVANIARNSREQRGGFAQVSDAIEQLDRFTQQNAAMVEQIAAAAQSLHQQADTLADTVARFKLPAPDAAPA